MSSRYLALLRAINVGGSRIIKMEDLRRALKMPGISDIATYIQSGNLVFRSPETDAAVLQRKIEAKIRKSFGFEVATFIRTTAAMKDVLKHNPFGDIQADKTIQLYVAYLERAPEKALQQDFLALENPVDRFHFAGSELYWLNHKSLGESKMSGGVIEKKLKMKATVRNWATTKKLLNDYLLQP